MMSELLHSDGVLSPGPDEPHDYSDFSCECDDDDDNDDDDIDGQYSALLSQLALTCALMAIQNSSFFCYLLGLVVLATCIHQ